VNTTRVESSNIVAGASPGGFRPSSRSRLRIAVGAILSMIAVGVVLLVFASADKRVAVLQVVRDLPAGTQLTADDVRRRALHGHDRLVGVRLDGADQDLDLPRGVAILKYGAHSDGLARR